MSNFHPLEVVARGSETQLQRGENVNVIVCTACSLVTVKKFILRKIQALLQSI